MNDLPLTPDLPQGVAAELLKINDFASAKQGTISIIQDVMRHQAQTSVNHVFHSVVHTCHEVTEALEMNGHTISPEYKPVFLNLLGYVLVSQEYRRELLEIYPDALGLRYDLDYTWREHEGSQKVILNIKLRYIKAGVYETICTMAVVVVRP